MSDLEDVIRRALREDATDDDLPLPETGPIGRLVEVFLRRSRLVAGFAWMKMIGTLSIAMLAAVFFFVVDSPRAQLMCASLFVAGFVGFAMWWTWYWQVVARNAQLLAIKRLELQVAELRAERGN